MKRTLSMVLLGTALLIPAEADAQRGRNAPGRTVAPERSARLANCRAPADGRSYVCRAQPTDRIVYRYAGNARPSSARVWITPSWASARVELGWRGSRRGEVRQRWLRDVVGARTIRRVRDHGHDAGLRGPVRGHWDVRHRSDVLVLTMEGQEVARMIDQNRDGRVDVFLLRNFRRW